jgi:CO/xanthine dehydrogenase Mo-binding subunit
VGGGFGQEGILYVEDVLIPFATCELGWAVRLTEGWTEDRQENLVAGSHPAEQMHHITLAADAGGLLLAVRDQITGGIAQQLRCALFEQMVYPDAGQPLTTTYLDYLLPTVDSVPEVIRDKVACASPTNEIGVKGLAGGGAIGAHPVPANAAEDALRPFRVIVRDCPLIPSRIRALLHESGDDADRTRF